MEVIRCKDCKYQIKEFRKDRRMKNGGYTVYACEMIGDLCGYWAWGGSPEQFCSEVEWRDKNEEDKT